MPFTPAHTAIVLPFLKSRWFSATGLIIGSMSPDFEYFFKMSVSSRYSHTFWGIFYFNIPVALLLALLFHEVVKVALVRNLPRFFQCRLQPMLQFKFVAYLKTHVWIFFVSVFIGAVSHLVWDGFTHSNGFFVVELPLIYRDSIIPFDGARYPLWYALQHISTLIGFLIVTVYFVNQKADEENHPSPGFIYWIGVLVTSFVITGIRFEFNFLGAFYGDLIVTGISAFTISLIIAGIAYRLIARHG
jgi:hypothetical protein